MMKRFKGIRLLCACAALTMVVAGCGEQKVSDGELDFNGVTVDFRGYRDWQTDKEFADFKEGIEKFKSDYPGVNVVTSVGGGFGYDKDLTVAVAAGDAWDLQYAQDSLGVPTAAALGLLEPLDQYIDWSDPFFDKQYMDQWKFDGKYYGIGSKGFNDFLFLWYRSDDFESVGLKTPYQQYKDGEWNHQAMLDAARVITKFDETGNPTKVILDWHVLNQYSAQNVIPFLYDSTDGSLTLNIDTPEMRDYLQFVYELGYKAKSVNYTAAEIVMSPLYTATFASSEHKEKWDSERREIVPVPTKDGTVYTYMHDNYLTVPKGSKNKQAAVILAKYVCEARDEYMGREIKNILSPEQFEMYNQLTETFLVKKLKFPGIDDLLEYTDNTNSETVKIITQGKPVSTVIDELKERLQPQVDLYNNNYAVKR